MSIQLIQVVSSTIKAIGYGSESQILMVQFKSKAPDKPSDLWEYAGVGADIWAELRGAESVGSYFAKNIKGRFQGMKVALSESILEASLATIANDIYHYMIGPERGGGEPDPFIIGKLKEARAIQV